MAKLFCGSREQFKTIGAGDIFLHCRTCFTVMPIPLERAWSCIKTNVLELQLFCGRGFLYDGCSYYLYLKYKSRNSHTSNTKVEIAIHQMQKLKYLISTP